MESGHQEHNDQEDPNKTQEDEEGLMRGRRALQVMMPSSSMEGPSLARISSASVMKFYNNSGLELSCSVRGRPIPSLHWMTMGTGASFNKDGLIPVSEVRGLRHLRRDSSLFLLPFPPENYSQEIHSTSYYCVASNDLGSIISHEIRVRAGKHHSRESLFLSLPALFSTRRFA